MQKILVIAEQDQGQLKLASFSAAGFAAQVSAGRGGSFDILLLGSGLGAAAEALRHAGAAAVLCADHPDLAHPLADRYAQVIADTVRARGATLVVAATSTFSKDILPRAAALLDAGMLSDVIGVEAGAAGLTFRRVMFAGNVVATVQLDGDIKFVAVRSSAFAAPAPTAAPSPVEAVAVDAAKLPRLATFLGRETKASARPDATEARIIVSGGRALKNTEDFERLVGGLADVLGAAVGSSRALVDAGITANSLQIGQTGKIVAPDLYIAVGISGAIQHMAGMKDTKVIAAINKDAEAPIFEVADYGLVADVYEAVPELIQKLRQ
ncbi:MAG: electron transfer flavoprotein subunit alpha/FixB family protein [bacterium]|nr:electron transfer flavoprotein subunit alpha/FixB family protein [bacterium]MDI1337257.1 electron transfer flavoprotein subunit alpha/FixB family protein [Lacunisphaera sp.]